MDLTKILSELYLELQQLDEDILSLQQACKEAKYPPKCSATEARWFGEPEKLGVKERYSHWQGNGTGMWLLQ
jgi:hypothetical protein